MSMFGGNFFLNNAIAGAIELPTLMGVVFLMQFGRKRYFYICVVVDLGFQLIPNQLADLESSILILNRLADLGNFLNNKSIVDLKCSL